MGGKTLTKPIKITVIFRLKVKLFNGKSAS